MTSEAPTSGGHWVTVKLSPRTRMLGKHGVVSKFGCFVDINFIFSVLDTREPLLRLLPLSHYPSILDHLFSRIPSFKLSPQTRIHVRGLCECLRTIEEQYNQDFQK